MEHSACGHGVLSMSRWLGEKQRGWAGAGPDPGKGLHRRPAQDPEGQRAPLGSTGWGESRGGWNPSVRVYLSQWRGVGHTTALRTRTRRPSNGVSRAIWGGGGRKQRPNNPKLARSGKTKSIQGTGRKALVLLSWALSVLPSRGVNAQRVASVPA